MGHTAVEISGCSAVWTVTSSQTTQARGRIIHHIVSFPRCVFSFLILSDFFLCSSLTAERVLHAISVIHHRSLLSSGFCLFLSLYFILTCCHFSDPSRFILLKYLSDPPPYIHILVLTHTHTHKTCILYIRIHAQTQNAHLYSSKNASLTHVHPYIQTETLFPLTSVINKTFLFVYLY